MKIIISSVQEFNPTIGGIERVSVSLANELVKIPNVEVLFVCCRKSPYSEDYNLPAKQYCLPSQDDYSQININSFIEIIEKEKADIILNQNAHSYKYNCLIEEVAKVTGIIVVSVFHFDPLMRIHANRNIIDFEFFSIRENMINVLRTICTIWPFSVITMADQRKLFRHLYSISNRTVLLSNNFFGSFVSLTNLKKTNKLSAINNMLSFPYEKENKIKSKKKQILFCGRMSSQKDPQKALYIWYKLQNTLSDWNLQMVGDGPYLEKCKNLSKKLGLQRVTFPGFRDPKIFFEESSIFWMTSRHEGWGLVLTEAMQNGCVPIAFDSFSSVSDIIDNEKNGFIIQPFDMAEFAMKTRKLCSDKQLLQTMSKKAYQKAENFKPEIIVKQWMSLFESLLK